MCVCEFVTCLCTHALLSRVGTKQIQVCLAEHSRLSSLAAAELVSHGRKEAQGRYLFVAVNHCYSVTLGLSLSLDLAPQSKVSKGITIAVAMAAMRSDSLPGRRGGYGSCSQDCTSSTGDTKTEKKFSGRLVLLLLRLQELPGRLEQGLA